MLDYATKAGSRRQAEERQWAERYQWQEERYQQREEAWQRRQEQWARSQRAESWLSQGAPRDARAASSGSAGPATQGWGSYRPTTPEGKAAAAKAPAAQALPPFPTDGDTWWRGEHDRLGDGGDPNRRGA